MHRTTYSITELDWMWVGSLERRPPVFAQETATCVAAFAEKLVQVQNRPMLLFSVDAKSGADSGNYPLVASECIAGVHSTAAP